MLTKLLKYEFKATARYFVPAIVALLAISVVNRICFALSNDPTMNVTTPTVISMMLYVAILIAVGVLALIITIKRFHSSLLTDEGYLMMTLPVSVDTHIISKIITSGVWLIASTLAAVISILIMVMEKGMFNDFFVSFSKFEQELFAAMGGHVWVFVVLFIIIGIANLICSLTSIYMCIAIGHQLPKHQLLAGVGAYLAYSTVLQVILALMMYASGSTGIADWFFNLEGLPAMYAMTALLLVITLALLAFTYCMTRYLLKNHLNLE